MAHTSGKMAHTTGINGCNKFENDPEHCTFSYLLGSSAFWNQRFLLHGAKSSEADDTLKNKPTVYTLQWL